MPDNMPNARLQELLTDGASALRTGEVQSMAAECLRFRKFAAEQQRAHNAALAESVQRAIEVAVQYGGTDGAHHKAWVIDQMVRELTNCPKVPKTSTDIHGTEYSYEVLGESAEHAALVTEAKAGEDGPNTYEWDEGTPP